MAELNTTIPSIDRLPLYPEGTVSIIADPQYLGSALALVRIKKDHRAQVADGYQIWACVDTGVNADGIPLKEGRPSEWIFVREAHCCYGAALLNLIEQAGHDAYMQF